MVCRDRHVYDLPEGCDQKRMIVSIEAGTLGEFSPQSTELTKWLWGIGAKCATPTEEDQQVDWALQATAYPKPGTKVAYIVTLCKPRARHSDQ